MPEDVDALAAEVRLLRREIEKLEGLAQSVGVAESCSACGSTARLDVGSPNVVNEAVKYVTKWRDKHKCGVE